MERGPDQVLQYMVEIESTAEEILAERQQMIDLDKKRQQTRQALRSVNRDKTSKKHWVCFGNTFIKVPQNETKILLQKDFDNIDGEISDIRKQLKPKVNKLRDLEHKSDLKGYDLNPLSDDELKTLENSL